MNAISMNQTFIVAAYTVTWIVLLGYMARLARKSSRVRRQYESMAHDASGANR
jgi:CcmD family protein